MGERGAEIGEIKEKEGVNETGRGTETGGGGGGGGVGGRWRERGGKFDVTGQS